MCDCGHSFDDHEPARFEFIDDELLIFNYTELSPTMIRDLLSLEEKEYEQFFSNFLKDLYNLKYIKREFAIHDKLLNMLILIIHYLCQHRKSYPIAILQKYYIEYGESNNKSIYKLYDAIEINFNTSRFLSVKQDIHESIIAYAQSLIDEDRMSNTFTEYILYGDNRDDRDKLLNNLALLVIGINRTDYVCILLYPILFKAFKEFKENIEKIPFGYIPVYEHPDADVTFGDAKFKPRKGVFQGGGYGKCNMCTCKNYIGSEGICNNCSHDFNMHEEISIVGENLTDFIPPIQQSEGIKSVKKALKDANIEYKKARFAEESKFKKVLVQHLNTILEYKNIPFFYIPIEAGFAKEWRPMSIKALNFNNTDFMDLYYGGNPRQFVIDAHGSYSYGLKNELKTIDLNPNEIVVMSCSPLEVTGRVVASMEIFCYNSPQDYKFVLLDYLMNNKAKSFGVLNKEKLLKKNESMIGIPIDNESINPLYRNNYCVYKKRCPNLSLHFYNTTKNPVTIYESIPRPVYEYPTQFSSRTIGELISKFKLPKTTQDIKDLSISNMRADNISSISQYLGNDIEHVPYYDSNYFELLNNTYDLSGIDSSISKDDKKWIFDTRSRLDNLIGKFDSDLDNPNVKEREIQTYYRHINPKKKECSTLFDEIQQIRSYYKSMNYTEEIIYFVLSCRI
jgi:hypothetical protein